MNVASWVVSPGGLSLGILTRFEQSSTSSDLLCDNESNNRAFGEGDIFVKDVRAEQGIRIGFHVVSTSERLRAHECVLLQSMPHVL